jgi:hypothetical protein
VVAAVPDLAHLVTAAPVALVAVAKVQVLTAMQSLVVLTQAVVAVVLTTMLLHQQLVDQA